MKKLRLLDSSGDTVIEFDETEATTKARDEAMALFGRLAEKGAATFAVNRGAGEPDKRVTDFNDLENDNIIVPRIVGG